MDLSKRDKDIMIASSYFMLFRTSLLKKLQGFNQRFFLYFEGFDLCLRKREKASIALVPDMVIKHFGGESSKKGLWHIKYFLVSAVKFFHIHGWRLGVVQK